MTQCPSCLKAGQKSFCGTCRKKLFDGRKVPAVLPFSRPDYNQAKLEGKADRLSISGIQTKISLALVDGRLAMVETGGQYILKPIPHGTFQRLDQVPVNEHLTMQLARQVFGIEVAENAVIAFQEGELAYLVRRFDLLPNGKAQQEDFCQLSNRTAELHGENYKYDGSYEEMGELIKKYVAAPAVALERFFKLVVFNYLVCNGDAHLKNFSLIMRDKQTQEYMLAPAYDLLNTHLHVPNERRTALELFKDDFQTVSYELNGFYAYDDFAELARRLGLIEKRYQKSLEDCLEKQEAVFSLIDRSLLSEECKHDYKEDVKDRIKALSLSHAK